MPGARGIPTPYECTDARGRRVPLFNPTLRRGCEVVGEASLSFPPDEMRHVVERVHPHAPNSFWRYFGELIAAVGGVSLAFGLLAVLVLRFGGVASVPWWIIPVVAVAPVVLLGVPVLFLKTLAERTWGVVAFTGEPGPVVEAMLSVRRCPSCAYPFCGKLAEDGCTLCTECGAVWRIT